MVSQSRTCNFISFSIKTAFERESKSLPTFPFIPFPLEVSASPLVSPLHSSHSLDFAGVCQQSLHAQRCVLPLGCFCSSPAAVWKGWCHSSRSISAQKGSNMPSSKGVAADAHTAGLCGSLPGFLKGKTCQLQEGGQQNNRNEPELEGIAKV